MLGQRDELFGEMEMLMGLLITAKGAEISEVYRWVSSIHVWAHGHETVMETRR